MPRLFIEGLNFRSFFYELQLAASTCIQALQSHYGAQSMPSSLTDVCRPNYTSLSTSVAKDFALEAVGLILDTITSIG